IRLAVLAGTGTGRPGPGVAGRVRRRRARRGGTGTVARAVPQPQLHAERGDRVPARLRDVRRDQLPAPVPAGGTGRLGDELGPVAAADDGRGTGDLAPRRPVDHAY